MIATDLVGAHVSIPSEGDAGWIRAIFTKIVSAPCLRYGRPLTLTDSYLWVLVERDNVTHDLKQYPVQDIVLKAKE